jgi:hypothetical protein
MAGAGTPAEPWELTTPPGTARYQAWMLAAHGDWMLLGGADEQQLGRAEVEHNAKNNRMRAVAKPKRSR